MYSLVNKYTLVIVCALGISIFHSAIAATTCNNPIRGVNLAGAEFGSALPGVHNVDYAFPTLSQLQYYSQAGFNATRLPISWERIQPKLFGSLDATYSQLLLNYMSQAATVGQRVVIDIHNYDRYYGQVVGSQAVPNEAYRDLWSKLATLLRGQTALYAYGLMNEPHDTNGLWHATAQYGVNGIRAADRAHYIYVPGDSWSGASNWPNINPNLFVNDPSGKVIYEAHLYFDDDYSGRYATPLGNTDLVSRVQTRLKPFTDWLVANHQKGVIGEWGVPTSNLTYQAGVSAFVTTTNAQCLDWFIWGGGQFRPSYILSLTPDNGVDKPMLTYLKNTTPLVPLKPH
jgi:endoglucanase